MEIIKKCTKCGEEKPISAFYYEKSKCRNGYRPECKACTMIASRRYRSNHREQEIRARTVWVNANRDQVRRYHREYYRRHREKVLEKDHRFYKVHKDEILLAMREYRAKNPHKCIAHRLVNKALRSGVLVKETCWVCAAEKTEAHHPDYNQPLYVYWLCVSCHRRLHWRMAEREVRRKASSAA